MSSKLFVAAVALAAVASAQATVSVTSSALTYSQSFNSLSAAGTTNAWLNDSTIVGWSLFNAGAVLTSLTNYRASTGTDTTGSIYSFGDSAERALGSVASGGATATNPTIALALTNNTGAALNSFTLNYDGEQWRNGGNSSQAAHKLTVQYGFGSSFSAVTNWTTAGLAFDFTSPVTTATAGLVNGNTAGLVANLGGTVATNWAAGDTLWIRWNDVNDGGNDHGLAIDNVNVTFTAAAVPEPTTYALLLAGLGAVGFIARRRRA